VKLRIATSTTQTSRLELQELTLEPIAFSGTSQDPSLEERMTRSIALVSYRQLSNLLGICLVVCSIGIVCLLAGCGGSNGGSKKSGGGGGVSTYTIGGTVSEMVGTGLVLQDNGGDNLSITGNGSFTFKTAINSGSAYDVTVLTQPSSPAQTCTVTNGSGTASANVTSVQVTCAAPAYTIGGSVSGLSGTGLVLQDNGGDNLTITGNGSFTFKTAINSGSAYEVTVLTQPSNPTQACSVTNGSGTAIADVTNVQVSCAAPTFTIGGTVSGLSGSGLVLQDNGGDDLTPTADGPFTFAHQLSSGATYNVTVTSQPTGQTCTVTNGTGRVSSTDVTNVIVACSLNQAVETILYSFDIGPDGASPGAGLVMDASGNLYGTTGAGGDANFGTVFEIAPNGTSSTESILHSFAGGAKDGANPQGDLLMVSGKLYGTTVTSGPGTSGLSATGTVFEITPNGTNSTETVLFGFTQGDGAQPWAGLVIDASGNFYGTTQSGGTASQGSVFGTVFEMTQNGTETVLHTFAGGLNVGATDGANPYSRLVMDASGNLYGTTYFGGANGVGTVFEIAPNGTETILHTFGSGTDGVNPRAGLVMDASGKLYGTTANGGAIGGGIVFEITPNGTSSTETVLHSFGSSSDGKDPVAGLVMDASGNLYGTTANGGAIGVGTVFKITPNGTETVLYSFAGGADGATPVADLVMDASGNLYGTTQTGGTHGRGTVFKITP
jgi:uncharacterized repeat protein (TIGR03803 family)